MIVVMKQTADADDTARVARHIEEKGFSLHISKGEARTIIGIIGANEHELDSDSFEVLPGVEKTMRIMQPFKAASRDFTQKKTAQSLYAKLLSYKGFLAHISSPLLTNPLSL